MDSRRARRKISKNRNHCVLCVKQRLESRIRLIYRITQIRRIPEMLFNIHGVRFSELNFFLHQFLPHCITRKVAAAGELPEPVNHPVGRNISAFFRMNQVVQRIAHHPCTGCNPKMPRYCPVCGYLPLRYIPNHPVDFFIIVALITISIHFPGSF